MGKAQQAVALSLREQLPGTPWDQEPEKSSHHHTQPVCGQCSPQKTPEQGETGHCTTLKTQAGLTPTRTTQQQTHCRAAAAPGLWVSGIFGELEPQGRVCRALQAPRMLPTSPSLDRSHIVCVHCALCAVPVTTVCCHCSHPSVQKAQHQSKELKIDWEMIRTDISPRNTH